MLRIAAIVSGGGTNLQALIDAQQAGQLGKGEITLVLSTKEGAYALERAKKAGIKGVILKRLPKAKQTAKEYGERLLAVLRDEQIDLVVLAGCLVVLGENVISAYPNRIVNVHPSLIPSFCGEGYYGLKVHQAALDYGVKVTGATVHLVSEVVDGGKILAQKAVDVLEGDTPETLQKRVMEQAEWVILPKAVAELSEKLSLA